MKRLKQQLQAEKIRFVENESLAAHCTFKIGGPADVFVQPETEEFQIIRSKSFVMHPMTPDEAILQMNMLDHTFFVFRNAESGEINVVYKRHDGNFALIEPEEE